MENFGLAFQQYLFFKELQTFYLDKLNELANTKLPLKAKVQFINCFDRWMIRLQETVATGNKFSRLPLFPTNIENHPANFYLDKDLNTKLHVEKVTPFLVEFIQKRQEEYTDSVPPKSPHVEAVRLQNDPNKLKLRIELENTIVETDECERINYLENTFGLNNAAHLVLRYETLGLGSQQWGPPKSFYNLLYDEFGVRNELFGKPLISGLFGKPGANVYTIFPDDTNVGCAGHSFSDDLFEDSSGNWVVVCSFIDDLLDKTAQKIIRSLESGHECLFFCIYPSWKDRGLQSWTQLNDSKFKLGRAMFSKVSFRIQECYGKEIKPNNCITLFLMGNIPLDDVEDSMLSLKQTFR